jgi:hypothetical protein
MADLFQKAEYLKNKTLQGKSFTVIRTGFKPVTRSLEGCCSIQLSYRTSNRAAN